MLRTFGRIALLVTFLPAGAAAQVEHGHPARAQHERRELVRLAQPAGPQRLDRLEEHLLHQVVCRGGRPQVTEAEEPDARSHAAAHLGLRLVVASGDPLNEVGICELDVHRPSV